MAKLRLTFSISTVASSTRMPTASARPPSVIVLSVCPIAENTMTDTRIDSGMETTMTSVERHEPRKSRIIRPGQRGGDQRLAEHAVQRRAHEHRLVEQRRDLQIRRQRRLDARQRVAHALHDVERRRVRRLLDRQQRRAPAVDVHHRGLDGEAVVHLRDVAQVDRRVCRPAAPGCR